MGDVLCEQCTAACCRYVALPIEDPETRRDFDDMRWYVLHQGVSVFVEDGEWYIQIQRDCRHILPDGRCDIYETRPQICREYTTRECDYHLSDENDEVLIFDNPESLMAYADEYFRKRQPDRTAKPKAPKRRSRKRPGQGRGRSAPLPGSAAKRKSA